MATLLETATKMYDSRSYDWGGPSEGPGPYDGTADIDGNARLDIDCSHLVHNVLAAAGYLIPYLSTSQLHSPVAELYFDVVTLAEANSNDLILYPKHVGVFATWDSTKGSGEYFGSQSKGPAFAKFDNNGTWGWKMNFVILRPKRASHLTQDHRSGVRWRSEMRSIGERSIYGGIPTNHSCSFTYCYCDQYSHFISRYRR